MRSRILTSILLVAALGLAGAGAITYLVQRDRSLASVDERLRANVQSARFVVNGDDATFPSTGAALQAVIARIIPSGDESALGVLNGSAAFVPGVQLSFQLEKIPGLLPRIVRETADDSIRLGTIVADGRSYRYIAIPVRLAADSSKGIYVVAVDLNQELAQLSNASLTYLLVALTTLVAIGLVGWFVAGRLLHPIRQLRAAASRITASERNERIPVHGRDDVSDLTATVNDMLDRLDGAITGQRQLLDDVRHELKTPITIVRGHLELLDATRVDEVLAAKALAIDELDRMSRLVDDIESLAHSQGATLHPRSIDVADFTAEVFEKVRVITDHDWQLAAAAHATVSIDSEHITQAWLQLADNAAKYSPAGSPIALGSSVGTDGVQFWIADRGPGIPVGSFRRIFERFGRADAGRGIHGSGLGLAIVKAIAVAHGGRVSVESSPRGSRFAIIVPSDKGGV